MTRISKHIDWSTASAADMWQYHIRDQYSQKIGVSRALKGTDITCPQTKPTAVKSTAAVMNRLAINRAAAPASSPHLVRIAAPPSHAGTGYDKTDVWACCCGHVPAHALPAAALPIVPGGPSSPWQRR